MEWTVVVGDNEWNVATEALAFELLDRIEFDVGENEALRIFNPHGELVYDN